jgi:hypothetical protein
VRRQVGAACTERAALAREDQLGPDAVRRGREQPAVVQRVEAGEGAEARGARGLDGGAQAPDDRLGRRE